MTDSARVSGESVDYDIKLDVPRAHAGIADLRDFVREHLVKWRFRGHHEDAILVISELVTNALVHGSGTPMVRLSGTPWRMRVEVSDNSPTMPAKRQGGATGGYGLNLIERMSLEWGAYPQGGGKVVWCELGTVLEPVAL